LHNETFPERKQPIISRYKNNRLQCSIKYEGIKMRNPFPKKYKILHLKLSKGN